MMIQCWRLNQFKSIKSIRPLKFAPLTIFTGANSSGKSSILQSILLISQTLASKVGHRHLVLNGEILRLGSFDDVVHEGADDRTLSVGFDLRVDFSRLRQSGARTRSLMFHPHGLESGFISSDLQFGPSRDSSPGGSRTLHGHLISGEFSAGLTLSEESTEVTQAKSRCVIRRRNRPVKDDPIAMQGPPPSRQVDSTDLNYEVELDSESRRSLRERHADHAPRLVGTALQHFLPSAFVNQFDVLPRRVATAFSTLLSFRGRRRLKEWAAPEHDDEVQRHVAQTLVRLAEDHGVSIQQLLSALQGRAPLPSATSGLDALAQESVRQLDGKVKPQGHAIEYIPVPRRLRVMADGIEGFFATTRYLGPLRDDPRPIYSLASPTDPTDVGSKGEFTAAVLDLYGDQFVYYVAPNHTKAIACARLRDAVQGWLRHFGLANVVRATEEGKLGHRLVVQTDEDSRRVDLTNVGVGVSQVLPIVVMALISEPGSLLVFEQPELHLHPKVQSLLADFFLAVTRTGRQCVVETHSEYLINRLRLRIAEAEDPDEIQSRLALYFAARMKRESAFQPVTIDQYGAVPNWPAGFFDEGPSESERILDAARARRRSKLRPEG